MFKIAKLEKAEKERMSICLVKQECWEAGEGKTDVFDTLSFNIDATVNKIDYSFSFDLNCRPEKLLEIPNGKEIDFQDYIFDGETFININNLNGIEPQMNISITRYLNNRFSIFLTFYTDYSYDDNEYSGEIEISFNLDDYIKK